MPGYAGLVLGPMVVQAASVAELISQMGRSVLRFVVPGLACFRLPIKVARRQVNDRRHLLRYLMAMPCGRAAPEGATNRGRSRLAHLYCRYVALLVRNGVQKG